ncbi:MAG: HIRAN domain-containing protein [Nocardioides sp.]|nr:HIRAN domain-containing protein [Nocardioides sp.]
MPAEDWTSRLDAYRRKGRTDAEIRGIADHLQKRGPRKPRTREDGIARARETGTVNRAVYVPADEEAPHLTRDAAGLPTLRLVDSGDRLSVWSPLDGGALLNPKGTGLRRFGLVATYARGSTHHAAAFRAADLRKGRPVELRREPDNPHDGNAVALYAPGAREPFGYVQKGRAPAVARRMDAGENMAGVSLRGPGPRRDDDTAFVLVGSAADLAALRGDA